MAVGLGRLPPLSSLPPIHLPFACLPPLQVLGITREMVTYARSLCEDVEFSAEDALRSDPAFLYQVYSVAVEAVRKGASGGFVLGGWLEEDTERKGHGKLRKDSDRTQTEKAPRCTLGRSPFAPAACLSTAHPV